MSYVIRNLTYGISNVRDVRASNMKETVCCC